MVEPVECRLQVGVQHPRTFRVGAADDRVDRHDRVVAPPARPEAVRLRLEPILSVKINFWVAEVPMNVESSR